MNSLIEFLVETRKESRDFGKATSLVVIAIIVIGMLIS